MTEQTQRSRRKAERRQQLLDASARLFADRGFHSVSIEDLGATVGISGPAVYRHFPSKEAILAELLVGASQRLLDGGLAEVHAGRSAESVLRRLVAFHADFALQDTGLIRVQDRDLASLPANEARRVRRLQRAYVELWVGVLTRVDPHSPAGVARTKAHAIFGLLNSTPHIAANQPADGTRRVLETMAMCALLGTSDLVPSEGSAAGR
jgi:AcrR family transcriptional regulator